MISRAIAFALLLLPACDQVFGVEPPPPSVVRGTFGVREVTNDTSGMPQLGMVPPDPTRASVTATFDDRSQVAVELAEDGTFEVERPEGAGARYRLLFQLDNQLIEVQHTAPELAYDMFQLGRPNDERTPPSKQMFVSTPVPLGGGGKIYVASTGLWSWTETTHDITSGSLRVDWRQHASLFGRRGLLDKAYGDRLYLLHYRQENVLSPHVLATYTMRDVQMVDGENVSLPLDETPVEATSCGSVTAPVVAEGARFTDAMTGWDELAVSARLQASISLAFGSIGAIDLVFSPLFTNLDLERTVRYGNPFPNTTLIASMRYEVKRTLRAPGLIAIPISSRLEHFFPIADGDQCATPIALHAELGIPTLAALEGIPLVDDGTPIRIDRSRDAKLTWEASDGPVDAWAIQLLEIYEDPFFGFPLSRAMRTYVTVDRELVIDPALLVPGAFYMFMIRADSGFPGAADGVFDESTYPRSAATTFTGLFVVQ